MVSPVTVGLVGVTAITSFKVYDVLKKEALARGESFPSFTKWFRQQLVDMYETATPKMMAEIIKGIPGVAIEKLKEVF